MKNHKQQEDRPEPNEQPADPTSAVVPLGSALSRVAHAFVRLVSHFSNRNRSSACAPFPPRRVNWATAGLSNPRNLRSNNVRRTMTPEKFFDYLEGKLPPDERERLERALIANPELQQEFVAARQIHRSLQRPADETAAVTRGRLARATTRRRLRCSRAHECCARLDLHFSREQTVGRIGKGADRGVAATITKLAREISRRDLFAANDRDGKSAFENPARAAGGGRQKHH